MLDRRLDSLPERVERPRPFLARRAHPPLEPQVLRAVTLDARLMADEPQEREVRIDLAVHHRLEVELEVGLTGKARVVAEEAESETVRDEAPDAVAAPVQELLHESVQARPRGVGDTTRRPIEIDAAADEVDR